MPTDPTDADRFRKIYTDLVKDGPEQVPGHDAVSAAILLMEYQDATQLMTNAEDGLLDTVSTNTDELRKVVECKGRPWILIVPTDVDNFLEDNDDINDGEREDD